MNVKLKNADLSLQTGFEVGLNEEMYQGIFKTMVKKGNLQMGKLSPEGNIILFLQKKEKREKKNNG